MEKRAEAAKQEKPENQEKSSQEKANQEIEGRRSGGKKEISPGQGKQEEKAYEGGGKDQEKQESKDKQAKLSLGLEKDAKSVEKLQNPGAITSTWPLRMALPTNL